MGDHGSRTCFLLEQYQFGQLIGEGSFSNVFVCKNLVTNRLSAVKITKPGQISHSHFDQVHNEANNLRHLKHKNLMKLEESGVYKMYIYLLLPLMEYGSCSQIARSNFSTGITEAAVGMILENVLRGLVYLHGQNFIHRAVKGSHILINEKGLAVLSGFKFAIDTTALKKEKALGQVFNFDLEDMTNNLCWLSPEILSQDRTGYNYNSDVYSLGITSLELANGVVPYCGFAPSVILVQKLEESPPKLLDRSTVPALPSQPDEEPQAGPSCSPKEEVAGAAAHDTDEVYRQKNFSSHFHKFVKLSLLRSPVDRPNSHQLYESKFIKTYRNSHPSQLLAALNLSHPISMAEVADPICSVFVESSSNTNLPAWDFSS